MLADIFDVSLDELTETSPDGNRRYIPPRGKHAFGVVRVGEKGQIVIPAKARKIFDIQPGDNLILLGDEAAGLAMIKETEFMQMVADFTAQPFMEEEP